MTGHDVNTFAASLVEMALATKRLPEAEQELSEANRRIDDYLNTIQRLELKLMQRANEIDSLKAQVRAAEVARDDAELRFLECDDAKSTLERTLETITGEISSVLAAVRPPVPTPTPEPEVKLVESPLAPSAPVAQSNPEASTAESLTVPSVEQSADAGRAPMGWDPHAYDPNEPSGEVGERAADPTTASTETPPATNAPSPETVPSQSPETSSTVDEGQHPGPFASSSSSEQSSIAGGGVENSGNAGSPTSPDPEPVKHDDHGFIRHEWWMWHARNVDYSKAASSR